MNSPPAPGVLRLHDEGRWSGGGHNMMSNARFAVDTDPDAFGVGGVPIVMRNMVPPSMLRGDFVYIPQNAWPFHGTARGLSERGRRAALRLATRVAMRRATGVIRIGPMIADGGRARPGFLSNVLDREFDLAVSASRSQCPAWVPNEPFAILPGSMWSYRNIEVAIAAHSAYVAAGGQLRLLIVGPPGGQMSLPGTEQLGGAPSRVDLVAESVERHDLLAAIRRSTVCLLTSLVEASPVTMLECAALERPMICWDTAGNRYMAERHLDQGPRFVDSAPQLTTALAQPKSSSPQRLSDPVHRHAERLGWCRQFVEMCGAAAETRRRS